MAWLAQLADGEAYRPCDWDLRADAAGRAYWLDHFCRHQEVLVPLLARCAEIDALVGGGWADGRLSVRATGSGAPLLDLGRLQTDFVAAVRDADLVPLHGMARAVESSFRTRSR